MEDDNMVVFDTNVLLEILVRLPVEETADICRTNKKLRSLCNSSLYWSRRLDHDYGISGNELLTGHSPKNIYRWIHKLDQDYGADYKLMLNYTDSSPERIYQEITEVYDEDLGTADESPVERFYISMDLGWPNTVIYFVLFHNITYSDVVANRNWVMRHAITHNEFEIVKFLVDYFDFNYVQGLNYINNAFRVALNVREDDILIYLIEKFNPSLEDLPNLNEWIERYDEYGMESTAQYLRDRFGL